MIAGTFKTSPSTAYFSNRPTLERKAPMLTELQYKAGYNTPVQLFNMILTSDCGLQQITNNRSTT